MFLLFLKNVGPKRNRSRYKSTSTQIATNGQKNNNKTEILRSIITWLFYRKRQRKDKRERGKKLFLLNSPVSGYLHSMVRLVFACLGG